MAKAPKRTDDEPAKRLRLLVDTTDEIRLAVKLAAMKAGMGISEFVNSVLMAALKDELQDARKYMPKKD